MYPYRISISLRVNHPSKSAIEICTRLDLQPFSSWSVGCPRYMTDGRLIFASASETYCGFKIPGLLEKEMQEIDGGDLDERLWTAAQFLEPKGDFLREIVETGGRNEFFIGCFFDRMSGETLQWQVLSALAKLRIDVALNLYPFIPGKSETSAEK